MKKKRDDELLTGSLWHADRKFFHQLFIIISRGNERFVVNYDWSFYEKTRPDDDLSSIISSFGYRRLA